MPFVLLILQKKVISHVDELRFLAICTVKLIAMKVKIPLCLQFVSYITDYFTSSASF
jgi:hypothetical protein